MGWVVNGPFGRHHKGPLATSFLIKADPEFHQMVKDFYDSGFSESSGDDKPEMSQEELRFLRELERTVVLRDGHYEMALPLKDREAPVPNNKPQVEQCAYWLKKKLQRSKGLYNDYKCFMADIVDKGYARKVPVDLQASSSMKWYIPHHGIYHPHKPGKIRVVFDCSGKYQGKSRKFNESFSGVCLDWKKIHSLPFLVALDTKSQEFQYKIINRYLVTNTFLKKIGKIDSALCCLLYTSPSPRDGLLSRMPSSA